MFADTHRRSSLVAGVAALAVLAACSDGITGPGGDFDPQAAASAVESTLPDPETNEDLYAGLELISGELAGASGSPSVATGLPQVLAVFRGEGTHQFVTPDALAELRGLEQRAAASPEVSLSLLLPDPIVGSTLVWDPGTGSYVVDASRTDAPPQGVRFVMYAVNPATHRPAEPLNEIGYVDLIDESTDESDLRLRVRAVDTSGSEPVTLLDYVIGGEVVLSGQTRMTAVAEGFVTDGTDRLDFALSQEIVLSSDANTATGTTSYSLSVPGSGVGVVLAMEGSFDLATGEPSSTALTLTVDDGTDRVVLDASVDARQALEGTVAFNGRTVIELSGTTGEPSFTRPDGSELSQQERQALRRLVEAVPEIVAFADSVFGLFRAA